MNTKSLTDEPLSKADTRALDRFRTDLQRQFGEASPDWEPVFEDAVTRVVAFRSSSSTHAPLIISYDGARGVQIKAQDNNPDSPGKGDSSSPLGVREEEEGATEDRSEVFPSIRFTGCC